MVPGNWGSVNVVGADSHRKPPVVLEIGTRIHRGFLVAGAGCSVVGSLLLFASLYSSPYFVVPVPLAGIALIVLGESIVFAGLWMAERSMGAGRWRAFTGSLRSSLRWLIFFVP